MQPTQDNGRPFRLTRQARRQAAQEARNAKRADALAARQARGAIAPQLNWGGAPCSITGLLDTGAAPDPAAWWTTVPSASLDWLSVSWRVQPHLGGDEMARRLVRDLLGWAGPIEECRGTQHFARHVRAGSAAILWDGHGDAAGTLHLQLGGQALREWEVRRGQDAVWLLYLAVAIQGRVRRLDLCAEDFDGVIDLVDAQRCMQRVEGRTVQRGGDPAAYATRVASKLSYRRPFVEYDETGGIENLGLQFGRRDTVFRIYDKQKQQKAAEVKSWTRCELQYRGDQAGSVADAIISQMDEHWDGYSLEEITKGLMRGTVRFLQVADHQNVSRWPTVRWWEQFLGTFRVRRVNVGQRKTTLLGSMNWFLEAAPIALAQMYELMRGRFIPELLRLAKIGQAKMRPERRAELDAAKERGFYGGLTELEQFKRASAVVRGLAPILVPAKKRSG